MSEISSKAEEVSDFGFSFEDDAEAILDATVEHKNSAITLLEEENKTLRENNRAMYRKILVLLNNLKKNPEQHIIKWPNRSEAIDKFVAELDELYAKAKKG